MSKFRENLKQQLKISIQIHKKQLLILKIHEKNIPALAIFWFVCYICSSVNVRK